MSAPNIINASGCPQTCGAPQTRVVAADLNLDLIPEDDSYVDMSGAAAWIQSFDLTTVPWGKVSIWQVNGGSDPDPAFQGLGGAGLENAESLIQDPAAPQWAYKILRTQILFQVPTQYLLICGYEMGGPTGGTAAEGCAGTFGGACAVMEIPWSNLSGYPAVHFYLVGPVVHDSTLYYPNLTAALASQWLITGPDWNPSQTCGPAPDQLGAP